MLKVEALYKSFPKTRRLIRSSAKTQNKDQPKLVLNDVNFNVHQGELFTLLGPSGCGKSTTLRSIAGLETPDSGDITVGDRLVYSADKKLALPPNERQLSMVFQSYAIWPHLNVFKNVSFPLEVGKTKYSRQQITTKVDTALAAVHLEGFGERSSVKLSGGQQQRLALARSLVTEPDLILLDEPLSNLDAKLRETMRIELKRLQADLGLTSVYVTHDQGEALAMSSRIAVMDGGKVVQVGRPREIYEQPNSKFVADFVGSSNIVDGTVVQLDDQIAVIDTLFGRILSSSWSGLCVGDEVVLMIRPEDIQLKVGSEIPSDENGWDAEVVAGSYLGEAIDYLVLIGGKEFKVRSGSPSGQQFIDRSAFASVLPDRVLVLPPERMLD